MTSSFLPFDRPVFFFRTVHFESFGPSTFAQDRSLSVVWTVQFNPPGPSTLDWTHSDHLIYKETRFPPYMTVHSLLDRPVESQWTVNFDARLFTLNSTPLVHSTAIVPTSSSYYPHYRSNFDWIFQLSLTFLTSLILSKFIQNFPTSLVLSNLSPKFPTSARTFQLQSFKFHIGLSNFSFFLTSLSNYTYP